LNDIAFDKTKVIFGVLSLAGHHLLSKVSVIILDRAASAGSPSAALI